MSSKPLLLVVASPAELLERMLSIFRSRATIADVIGAETAERALELSVQHAISAVAVDEYVADRTGCEIIKMLKDIRPEVTALLLATPSNTSLYQEAQSIEGSVCIDKTADLEGVVAKIASHLFEREVGFRGLLDNLELPDILQLICLRGESRQVRITTNSLSGLIFIKEGQVVHARTATLQGERAFFDLFGWKGGDFKLQPLDGEPKKTIEKPWESLLLEAGQMLDEGAVESLGEQHLPEAEVETPPPEPVVDEILPSPVLTDPTATQGGRPPLEEMPGVVIVRKDRDESSEQKSVKKGRVEKRTAEAVHKEPKPAKIRNSKPSKPRSIIEVKSIELKQPARTTRKRAHVKRKQAPVKKPQVRRSRTNRGNRIRKAATWTVIVMMSIPTALMIYLAVPWMTVRTEVESQVQQVLSGEFVPRALAKSSPVLNESQAPEPLPNEWEALPGICEVRIAPLEIFNDSGNLVALAGETFDELKLEGNPWVELVTPSGIRMGAMAVRWEEAPELLYVRRTMALALEVDETRPFYVKVEPILLDPTIDNPDKLVFSANRQLAEAYCESWYAAGIGLSVMQDAKLTPGSYAIAEGPMGYQSVMVQVMDRGNPGEVWLSKRAREALGVNRVTDQIILHPKIDLPLQEQEVEDEAESPVDMTSSL